MLLTLQLHMNEVAHLSDLYVTYNRQMIAPLEEINFEWMCCFVREFTEPHKKNLLKLRGPNFTDKFHVFVDM